MYGGEHGIDLVKQSLEIKKNIFGEDSPEIAESIYYLSGLYHNIGDIHNAKKTAQEALLLLQDTDNNTVCK